MWRVDFHNDVGPNDDCYVEWWEVADGNRKFESKFEDDAKWLCALLNGVDRVRDEAIRITKP
jgi:hypothetical protein